MGAEARGGDRPAGADRIRLDKWLWHARLFKSRSLAAEAVTHGRMRVNGEVTAKPAHPVRPGDVLTYASGRRVVVVRILAPGTRRGPAPEARALYEDLAPPPTAPGAQDTGPDDSSRTGPGSGSRRVD